ncbi:DNA-3-methyladenine glycosylase I [Candidatus Woesearchaeota archaeon]|nr:DNA-3-methyladenine glycosylase I [Candidatus Woesearchaeota archaeon]
MKNRCFGTGDSLYEQYHDEEWAVPVHDDRTLFEFLILEGAQAGLSWSTILKRREGYRRAFHDFDPQQVARMTYTDVKRLMNDVGIIRNRLKIESAISNAQAFLDIQKQCGSFDSYIWQFTNGKTIRNYVEHGKWQATSKESDAMSKDLKKRGFRFVGSTICYAFMQAVGMVNDHAIECWKS